MKNRFPGEMTVLGDFEMTSQTMRVSDPCYDRDVWCCGTFGKCKTGIWEAGVLKTDMGDWGVRCAVLAVRHKETGPDYSVIRQAAVSCARCSASSRSSASQAAGDTRMALPFP